MSTMTESIRAFNDLDYDVVEWNSTSVTIKSVHDYDPSLITIHRNMHQINPDWIKAHFVDRLTPYMQANYSPSWKRERQ